MRDEILSRIITRRACRRYREGIICTAYTGRTGTNDIMRNRRELRQVYKCTHTHTYTIILSYTRVTRDTYVQIHIYTYRIRYIHRVVYLLFLYVFTCARTVIDAVKFHIIPNGTLKYFRNAWRYYFIWCNPLYAVIYIYIYIEILYWVYNYCVRIAFFSLSVTIVYILSLGTFFTLSISNGILYTTDGGAVHTHQVPFKGQ